MYRSVIFEPARVWGRRRHRWALQRVLQEEWPAQRGGPSMVTTAGIAARANRGLADVA
jgi:hypothetical protein